MVPALQAQRRRSARSADAAAGRGWDRLAGACLLLGLLGLVLGLVVALSHAEPRLTGRNAVVPRRYLPGDLAGRVVCQRGERVPAGTAGLRLPVTSASTPGPDVVVTLRRQGRLLDRATASPEAGSLTVDVP